MSSRPIHPAALVWPMLPADELQALADDIAANGLRDKITVSAKGEVIDGRNRLAACEMAGIDPSFAIFDEGDTYESIIELIGSRNSTRRHMTTGARAMARAVNLKQAGKRRDGRWEYGAKSNRDDHHDSTNFATYLAHAGLVLDHASDETVRAIITGEASLDGAYREVKDQLARDEADRQRRELLAEKSPDLAAQVDAETLSLDEAVAADHTRRREEIERDKAKADAARQFNLSMGNALFQLSVLADLPDQLADFAANYQPPAPILTVEQIKAASVAVASLVQQWSMK